MPRARVLAALLVLTCARRPGPSAAGADAASPNERRLQAFRHCYEVTMRVARGGAPGHSAVIARACADVYSEPGCASVMRDPPRRSEAITGAIAAACRNAYCPRLAAPRPTLCAMLGLPPPVELGRRWRELQNRILALELDVARFTSLLQGGRVTALVRASFQSGVRSGVNGTPTFFINGVKLDGMLPAVYFDQAIAYELGRA